MNGFFSIIGSIASLVSIPLAIYLYLKSREAKFDKLKKEIARILSYQIGDERKLSTFEIETVINSKLRENNVREDSVTVSEMIEDLVAETISSPLIGKERKSEILDNLKKIYFRGEIFEEIDKISELEIKDWNKFEPRFKNLIQHRSDLDKKLMDLKSHSESIRQRMSTIFAFMSLIMLALTLTIALVGQETFLEWDKQLSDPFKDYEFAISIILGSITSLIAGIMTFLFRKRMLSRQKKD